MDAFAWLAIHGHGGPVVSVLPDAAEVGMTIWEWESFYERAAKACLRASTGPTIFLATDRKHEGRWISKPELFLDAAGGRFPLLWHKIVLRRPVDGLDPHRPTYSHLMAFGPGRPGRLRPDVIDAGTYLWRNGIGVGAARFVADYLDETGNSTTILNPFCGMGTLLAAAEERGLTAFGCDTDPDRVARARDLDLTRSGAA